MRGRKAAHPAPHSIFPQRFGARPLGRKRRSVAFWGKQQAAARIAGRTSYARRLMFSRWRGEMLSDVILPPQPPHPSVIAGSSPVVSPIDP